MRASLPTQQEQDDLSRLQAINTSVLKLEAEKQEIMERLIARYSGADSDPSKSDVGNRPVFTDPYQECAFDHLKRVRRSNSRGIVKYGIEKGLDFGNSSKPGAKLPPLLRKMPDVFLYEKDSEMWYLSPKYA